MDKYRAAELAHEAMQRNIARTKERCDRALVEFQRGARCGFRQASLQPFEGRKLSVEELCAVCGLVCIDGKVDTPQQGLRRAA